MSVDLPEPDGPMIATNSPASITRSMPLRTWSSLPPTSYERVMPRSSMSAMLLALLGARRLSGGRRRPPAHRQRARLRALLRHVLGASDHDLVARRQALEHLDAFAAFDAGLDLARHRRLARLAGDHHLLGARDLAHGARR